MVIVGNHERSFWRTLLTLCNTCNNTSTPNAAPCVEWSSYKTVKCISHERQQLPIICSHSPTSCRNRRCRRYISTLSAATQPNRLANDGNLLFIISRYLMWPEKIIEMETWHENITIFLFFDLFLFAHRIDYRIGRRPAGHNLQSTHTHTIVQHQPK